MVTAAGFDPARTTVVEDPDVFGAVRAARGWDARIVGRSPTELRIRLEPANGGVLTVRSAFDPGWRAEVDGHDARMLPVDGFLQGVITREGSREVVLTYHDDPVMIGLALGAAAWGALLAAPFLALASQRRAARSRSASRHPRRTPPRMPVA